jgi:cardiolipin synthase A/B
VPSSRHPRKRKRLWFALGGVAVGIVIFIIASNFMPNEAKVEHPIASPYGVADPQFTRTIGTLIGPPLIPGNSVTELLNGDAIFPAMLGAIREAQETITFETYIYWSGDIGQRFADALSERARAGVRVLVLLDWQGSVRMDADVIDALKDAGCSVVRYHAPKWYHLTRLNNRTHRKLLIVDGRIGFTGGVGIGDEWLGNAQSPDHWRDTHFQAEGPIVGQMQAVFMANWIKATAIAEHTGDFFPALEPAGELFAQMIHSSPEEGSENTRLMYLLFIASARETILLQQAYFVPDNMVITALVEATRRGVKIEVIVPGELSDAPRVRQAGRARWGRLLEAGVRIFEYQPTNLHSKVMIVDGLLSSVGSTNFDNRSFRINDEANLNVYDAGFAQQLTRTHDHDRGLSREISLAEWQARSRWVRFTDWFWSLFRHQM